MNSTVRSQIQQAINEALPESSSIDILQERLEQNGITVRHYEFEDGTIGWSFEKDGECLAGYEIGRSYTKPAILRTLQQSQVRQQADLPTPADSRGLSRELQPQRNIGDLLHHSVADSEHQDSGSSESETTQWLGRDLQNFGARIQTQTPDVDGPTVIGTAASLAGMAMTLGAAFQQMLKESRQRADGQRLESLIDQLQAIGDRTTQLEDYFEASSPSASAEHLTVLQSRSQAASEASEMSDSLEGSARWVDVPGTPGGSDPWLDNDEGPIPHSTSIRAEPDGSDFLGDSVSIANERLNRLDRLAGIDDDRHDAPAPFRLDRTVPLSEQLDQLEVAINHLSDRLARLEEFVLESPQRAEGPTTKTVTAEAVAECLFHYASSRAAVYDIPLDSPIETRTLGTINVHQDADSTIVSVTDETYGVKFEAVNLESSTGDSTWVATHSDLSPGETARIVGLPQTVNAYEQQVDARALIGHLQRAAPAEFEGQEGHIQWQEKSGAFTYDFHVAKDRDGGQRIIGVNAEQEMVFETHIRSDGTLQAAMSTIPTDEINGLLKEEAAQEHTRQRLSQQRTHSRDLSL